jgi:hypothetical protein
MVDSVRGGSNDPNLAPMAVKTIGVNKYQRLAIADTATLTSVADSAASQQLLAANALRLGFRIFNDSTVTLYLKYGVTASLTSFTVSLPAGAFFSEDGYIGRVDGIWASDAAGSARITELT